MHLKQVNRPTRLFSAGMIALAITFTAGDGLAGGCSNGKCGPSNTKIILTETKTAASTVQSDNLQTAYDKLETIIDKAGKLNVDGSRTVRESLRDLASTLDKRASQTLSAAIISYFEGDIDGALAKFEELAKLKGLPTALRAQKELDKEESRSAWRDAHDLASKHIANQEYLLARQPLNEMERLARRTGYRQHFKIAVEEFSERMKPVVQATATLIAQGQYETSYARLIGISRLTHAHPSSSSARKMLNKHARIDGMRLAKREYSATEDLTKAKSWYDAIAHPSSQEQQRFTQKLEAIVDSYKGTVAASQAQAMLGKNTQAAY